MAKGNIGNLLQHFVALHALQRLATVADRFAYVDLFAMEPWEDVPVPDAAFRDVLHTLPSRSADPVAAALIVAQQARGADLTREYPNTTALALHAGFPLTSVTACEIDDTKRAKLERYILEGAAGTPLALHGDCTKAKLAKCGGAAFVIMDPLQVDIDGAHGGQMGYISIAQIRGVLGSSKLDVLARAKTSSTEPCIATIFSYSEPTANADETDRALRRELGDQWGWRITRVAEPTVLHTGRKRSALHQGWWCASADGVAAPADLQDSWDKWRRYGT
jgi:hypothetical protein